MEDIILLLKKRQLKATPQRVLIAKTIKNYGHIDIDSLFDIVKKELPTISLATLYKNIHSFIEKRFVREVTIPNYKTRYELITDNHAHFICTKCGKIQDIKIDETNLEKLIIDEVNNIERISISLFGECCKK